MLLLGLNGLLHADTFRLTTGEDVTGDPVSDPRTNEFAVRIRLSDDSYVFIPWTKFSQESLKTLSDAGRYPQLKDAFGARLASAFLEPYIVNSQAPRWKPPIGSLQLASAPASHSVVSALFSSPLGLFILLALYAANVYAAYEVSIFRARPPALVAGLAAIPFLGVFATVAFLVLPSEPLSSAVPAQEDETPAPSKAPDPLSSTPSTDTINPMQSSEVAHPTNLKLAQSDTDAGVAPAKPETVAFKRGQFTFNRRFIETRFGGFFGAVRRDPDRDMVLVIKAMRGQYVGQRITRISANEFHLLVHRGPASEEVVIPFVEIQEIVLKHKDAP